MDSLAYKPGLDDVMARLGLLHDRRVAAVVVGARSVEQLEDNLGVGGWDLPADQHDAFAVFGPVAHGYLQELTNLTYPNIYNTHDIPPRPSP